MTSWPRSLNAINMVGDDIMMLVVAGDVRTNVIPVMASLIDAVKATVTSKAEVYKD